VAVGTQSGNVNILNLTNTSHVIRTLSGHANQINRILNLNNTYYATASDDTTIRIWNATNGSLLSTLIGHTGGVRDMAVLWSGMLVSVSCDKTINIWNSYYLSATLSATICLNAIVLLNEPQVAIGGNTNYLSIWNLSTKKLVMNLTGHSGNLIALEWIQSSNTLISGSGDQTVKFWNVSSGLLLSSINLTSSVKAMKLFNGSNYLAVQCFSSLKIINTANRSVVLSFTNAVSAYAIETLLNGSLATGSSDGLIKTWTGNFKL
jgi:WD40 repeat protein